MQSVCLILPADKFDSLSLDCLHGVAELNVTAVEPNPSASPLSEHPNVFLSPHASTSLEGYGERVTQLFVDNLARWRSGSPLQNVVNPNDGY